MAGQKITRGCARRLNDYGQEKIMALYIEHGSVRRLLKNLPEKVGAMSSGPFYKWLKSDESRWREWQMAKAVIASTLVEEALEIVDGADDGSVQSARLRAEQRRWMSERYNREEFGKPDSKAAEGVSFPQLYLQALIRLDSDEKIKEEAKAENDIVITEAGFAGARVETDVPEDPAVPGREQAKPEAGSDPALPGHWQPIKQGKPTKRLSRGWK